MEAAPSPSTVSAEAHGVEVSAAFLAGVLQAVDELGGTAAFDTAFDEWGVDVRQIVAKRGWITDAFAERVVDKAVEIAGVEVLNRAAFLCFSPTSVGPIYPLLRAFGSPWSTIRRIVRSAPRFTKVRTQRLEQVGPTHARIYMSAPPGGGSGRSRHTCQFIAAQMRTVPTFFGCPTRVVHNTCIVDKAAECTFDIVWQEPAKRRYRTLASLGVGGGMAGLIAVTLGAGPALVALCIALALLTSGLVLSHRRQAQVLSEQLQAVDVHADAVESSLEESEGRYAELLEAKKQVDEKVGQRTAALSARSEQLAHALEELRAADEAKSNFLNHISHELRTPLTLILGPLRAMQSDQLSADEVRRHADTMSRNAEQLLRMINELLDLARSESGHESLSRQAVSVDALAQESLAAMESNARLQGLEIRTELASAAPLSLDAHWLKSAVDNLLSNALAHARTKVRLRTEVQGSELHIEVSDNGEGIASELQASIFDRYVRAPHTKRVGSGLGLAIVREAARLHGGDVSVESEPGKGATFRISVPAKPAESTEQSAPRNTPPTRPPEASSERAAPYPNAPHLLVVEDHEDLRAFIADILAPRYAVHGAHNGLEGLKLARKLHPDVIITDVAMDGMDGLELTRELRQDPTTRDIPILVVTARGEPEAAVRGFEAGAADYIPKPFHAAELLARVDAQLKLRQAQARIAHAHRVEATRDIAIALLNQLVDPLSVVLNILPQIRSYRTHDTPTEAALQLAQTATHRLGRVVDLIEHFAAPPSQTAFRPVASLTAIAELYRSRAPQLHLELDLQNDTPTAADAAEVNQAIIHILDDTLDATKPDSIRWLRVQHEIHPDHTRVLITANRPPIPGKLLDPAAWRLRPGNHGGHPDPALRLAMAKHAIESQGGTLQIESSERGLTTFRIELPNACEAVDSSPDSQTAASAS